MSKLKQLIQELCPDGVEWKTLRDIGKVSMCKRILKEQTQSKGDIPFYKIGTFGKEPNAYISKEIFEEYRKKYSYPNKGDILISAAGTIGRTVIFDGVDSYFQDSNIVWVANNEELVLNEFLFHFYKIAKWYVSTGGTISRLYNENIEKTPIPIPPLPIQEEIVRILDNFNETQTELINQLEEELKARKQQYEYCRDSLLTFGDDVELKPLDKIKTEMYRGSGIKRDQITAKGIPCVRYGEIYTTYNICFDECVSRTIEENIPNRKYFGHGDVLFAITGESIEDIAKSCVYLGQEKCLAGGDTVVMKHNENPKFLSYALSTNDAKNQKGKGKVKSKVVHSSVPALKEITIPIPPIPEQERIVTILDNLDNQIVEITQKLSEEISARKQQYEYYRDTLLTFKEL